MARGNGAKNGDAIFSFEKAGDFEKICRRIVYFETIIPRYSSLHDAVMHFYVLDGRKLKEYELKYADNPDAYNEIIRALDHYEVIDMFRSYRFHIISRSVRVLMRKGISFDANGDLGGFVFQSYKTSHLVSPKYREIFDRLRKDTYGHIDGTAQLVKLSRLLKNERFLKIHNEYFGKLGVAALNDSAVMKSRYADCLTSNSIVTDAAQFREYLDIINTIPMSDFAEPSIISQMSGDLLKIKNILEDNYCNFLFVDEDEMDFMCVLLAHFLCPDNFVISTEDWVRAVSYERCIGGDSHLRFDEDELDFERELLIFRACYIFDKVDVAKLVHFFYDFFEYNNLSRNVGTFYERLNDLLGEDIREKFLRLETINVSLKSYTETNDPCVFFKYPQLVNFSTAADRQIQKEIISGEYNRNFIAFYLCNYMQVADYKKYSNVLPAVVSILKNLTIKNDEDYNLYWMACDLLNYFWKTLPGEDAGLNNAMEKLVYELFWPRVGDVWPIKNRNRIKYVNEPEKDEFEEALGWVLCLDGVKRYDSKLKAFLNSYVTDKYKVADDVENKCHDLWFAKQKNKSIEKYVHSADAKLSRVYYSAIFCDDIDKVDLFKYLLARKKITSNEVYAMEQLFLQFKDTKNSKALYDAILEEYDKLVAFYKGYDDKPETAKRYLFDSFASLCESATNDIERDYLKQLSEKCKDSLGQEYDDIIARTLLVADAHIRQTNFQTKDVSVGYIEGLL